MRLIDADALLNELGDIWNIPKDWDGDIDETCETAFDVIENAPTVEAKPVVHGEWIKIKDWDENDNALFECNNCHHGDTHAKAMKVPYCWHCGAKMSYAERGGKND